MTINDKIKQILIEKDITPSYFADEIGVQRSSISHILSGRNRPSFDVIQKVIRRFPELGYEWIMEEDTSSTGQSSMKESKQINNGRIDTGRSELTASLTRTSRSQRTRSQRNEVSDRVNQTGTDESQPLSKAVSSLTKYESSTRKAERIVVFYTDGSFQEYVPSE